MKLLIIGATSYIGNAIYCEAKTKMLVIGTRNHTASNEFVSFDMTKDDLKTITGNFPKGEKWAVVCSAQANIDRCFTCYDEAKNINVTATKRLLDGLGQAGFHTVFLSTDNVFSGRAGYYKESDPKDAINAYGKMKAEVEDYILSHCEKTVIMRISKIVGDIPHARNMFTEWQKKAQNGESVYCIQNNIFSPTDLNDIVNCCFTLLKKKMVGLYNVCNQEHFDRAELARQFFRRMDAKIDIMEKPLDYFSFKDKHSLKTYLCNDKFVRETGYMFRSMNDVMEKYLMGQVHIF
ncbi:sugar nucleotide-binding protein [Lachnospiraceae bacterium ZAX-1]